MSLEVLQEDERSAFAITWNAPWTIAALLMFGAIAVVAAWRIVPQLRSCRDERVRFA